MTIIRRAEPSSPKALRQIVSRDLNRHGLAWFKIRDSVKEGFRHPLQFAQALVGQVHCLDLMEVRPRKGSSNYLETGKKADFHTDQDLLYMPAALQIFICVRQALSGGESRFIDTWSLLKEIRRHDKTLYRALFNTPRVLRFNDGMRLSPTFALNDGNLVCAHPPFPDREDEVGAIFQKWVDQAPRIRLRLEPDDVLISNNHRILHSRTAFVGSDRFLIRMMAWPRKANPAPAAFTSYAREFQKCAAKILRGEPHWIRQRFGLAPPPRPPKIFYDFPEVPPEAPEWQSPMKRRSLFRAFDKLREGIES